MSRELKLGAQVQFGMSIITLYFYVDFFNHSVFDQQKDFVD